MTTALCPPTGHSSPTTPLAPARDETEWMEIAFPALLPPARFPAPIIVLWASLGEESALLAQTLQRSAYKVRHCSSLYLVLQAITKQLPDGIIVDTRHAVSEGTSLFTWLSRHPQTQHIPVLLLTDAAAPSAYEHAPPSLVTRVVYDAADVLTHLPDLILAHMYHLSACLEDAGVVCCETPTRNS